MEEETNSIERNGLPFLHFSVQLQNIFAAEIVAKHYPVDQNTYNPVNTQVTLNLEEIQINEATSIAQVILSVQVLSTDEPRLFEVAFKQVGLFVYSNDYSPERVQAFLEQGSLSVMLPFARETLLSLCVRLQIPPITLPMVRIASPSTNDAPKEGTP